MEEGVNLVAELALILIAAGAFTLISKWLKQPLILGYIVAGFIVGPHLGLFPQMTHVESIEQWSEIGIIFLLFALGLEFSFKKLLKVGSSALITAGVKCIGMFVVGIVVGGLMGWSQMESIFLGGLLSMSSTTIIIKAYDDMGLKKKPYASLIFGSLVIEDLIAVLLMVLLSTLAVSNKFEGTQMLLSLAKLAFYLIIWFIFGIYLIPTLLKKARAYLSDEILLTISIGLCFGMVALASAAGFSSALGAFVMGSILAETFEGERISKLMGSIKDLFGAIFFVSVGMMVDPALIAEHWLPILVITVVAMLGILVFSTSGALLAGKGLDVAVHAGFSLAQLGEFAFIIASLGCSLGVMREFIYPVIIAVSVLTTFTTPYMIMAADPAVAFLHRVLPAKVLSALEPRPEQKSGSSAETNEWHRLLKMYALRIFLYLVVIAALNLLSRKYLSNIIFSVIPSASALVVEILELVISLAVLSPLLYGMAVYNSTSIKSSVKALITKKPSNKFPILALILLRFLIGVFFINIVCFAHCQSKLVAVLLSAVLSIILFRSISHQRSLYGFVESRFMANFNAREEQERREKPVTSYLKENMAGYDIHIESVTVPYEFSYVGKTLREMPFRNISGVNVIKIIRGPREILIPGGTEVIYPADVLVVVGTSEQLQAFNDTISSNSTSRPEEGGNEEMYVGKILVDSGSPFCGKTLKELNMRASHCMVISYMRDGVLHANPHADQSFVEGDVVWIAGEKSSCSWYE